MSLDFPIHSPKTQVPRAGLQGKDRTLSAFRLWKSFLKFYMVAFQFQKRYGLMRLKDCISGGCKHVYFHHYFGLKLVSHLASSVKTPKSESFHREIELLTRRQDPVFRPKVWGVGTVIHERSSEYVSQLYVFLFC